MSKGVNDEGQGSVELLHNDYNEPPIQMALINMDDLLCDGNAEEETDNEKEGGDCRDMDSDKEGSEHKENSNEDGVESDPEGDEDIDYGDM